MTPEKVADVIMSIMLVFVVCLFVIGAIGVVIAISECTSHMAGVINALQKP